MPSLHHHPPPPHGGAPLPQPKPNQKFLSLILKAIIMIVITIFFFFFLGVAAILLFLATAALHRHSTPPPDSSNGLSRKDLRRLPQMRYSRKMNNKDAAEGEIECVVCLEGFKHGQWFRKLDACGHVFHRRCVDSWLVKVASCPVCRTRVRVDLGSLIEGRPFWGFGWRNDLWVW